MSNYPSGYSEPPSFDDYIDEMERCHKEELSDLQAQVDEMKALSQWVRADIEKPDVGEVVYVAVLEDYTVTIADQDVEMTRIAYDLGCVEHEGYGVIAFAYSDSWVVGWKRIEPFTMEEGAG